MVVKLGLLSNILSTLMYKDRLTAQRSQSVTNSDGSKGSIVLDSFLENEPCLVHETTSDFSKDDSKDVARKEITVRVFCNISTEIHKGDFLILSVLDDNSILRKTIQGFAGEPAFFPDHLEIDLYDWSVGQ